MIGIYVSMAGLLYWCKSFFITLLMTYDVIIYTTRFQPDEVGAGNSGGEFIGWRNSGLLLPTALGLKKASLPDFLNDKLFRREKSWETLPTALGCEKVRRRVYMNHNNILRLDISVFYRMCFPLAYDVCCGRDTGTRFLIELSSIGIYMAFKCG